MPWIWATVCGLAVVPLLASLVHLLPAWAGAPAAPHFVVGAIVGVVGGLALRRRLPMLVVLEHELTHLLAALLLLRRPMGLSAGKNSGRVTYQGRGSTLIRLAPYAAPTLTLLALLLTPLIAPGARGVYALVLGLTWGYHVYTTWHEARPHQTDLQEGGLVASYVTLAGLTLVLYGGAALASVGRFSLVGRWFGDAWARAVALLS